jgi:hypothetical protein
MQVLSDIATEHSWRYAASIYKHFSVLHDGSWILFLTVNLDEPSLELSEIQHLQLVLGIIIFLTVLGSYFVKISETT